MSQPYDHLFLSENLRACIGSVSELEWTKFFDSLYQSKTNHIESLKEEELTNLPGKCSMITETKAMFIALRKSTQNQTKTEK